MSVSFVRRTAFHSCAAAALLAFCAPIAAEAQELTYSFDIPAQALAPALSAFGRQSRQQVVFDSGAFGDRKSSPVIGSYTATRAINTLLAGTGFSARLGSKGEFVVVKAMEDAAADPERTHEIDEVIVTAQKKSERLTDVPTAVQAVAAQNLAAQGLLSLSDYAKQFPALATGQVAGPGFVFPVIRGISAGNDNTSPTGIYIDDIPMTGNSSLGSLGSPDPDLSIVDHIEVLEGPQSTLYGANALGGIIKYVTRQPDPTRSFGNFEAYGSKVDGGNTGGGVRGGVNVPLPGADAAFMLSAFARVDPGFINNSALGKKGLNQVELQGGHLAVLFNVGPDIENKISVVGQHLRAGAYNGTKVDPTTFKLTPLGWDYPDVVPASYEEHFVVVSDTTRWQARFATLSNTLSYSYSDIDYHQDYSIYDSYYGVAPQNHVEGYGPIEISRITDETRLASAPGRLEYLLGTFFINEHTKGFLSADATDPNGVILVPSDPNNVPFRDHPVYGYTEGAIFGDLTYHFTDRIGATFGLRYDASRSTYHEYGYGNAFAPSNVYSPAPSRSTASAVSYLATVSYKPTSNTTVYVRAASAYQPGGTQAVLPQDLASGAPSGFGPDTLWNFEIGAKGELLDHRLVYSAAAFHMIWKNLQTYGIFNGDQYLTNIGSALSDGVEGAVTIKPIDGLTVTTAAAYMNPRITADLPLINAVSGQQLPYSQKFNASIVADYTFDKIGQATPDVGLTWAYRDSVLTDFSGTQPTYGTGGLYKLPAYKTLDMRAGLSWSRYRLSFRVINLTNTYALTRISVDRETERTQLGQPIQPRTFSLSLAARF